MIQRLLLNRQTQVRFIKFFTVGALGYIVNVGFFNALKGNASANGAFTIAFIISTCSHYTLNRFWALRSVRSDSLRQFIEYLMTVVLSYAISWACFKGFHAGLGLSLGAAQALSIPPSTIVTFFILNFRVFKGHHKLIT